MGIITVEDLLEEIVGDIEDESDLSARVSDAWESTNGSHLDMRKESTLKVTAGFELPDGDFETIAGYILSRTGRFHVRRSSTQGITC